MTDTRTDDWSHLPPISGTAADHIIATRDPRRNPVTSPNTAKYGTMPETATTADGSEPKDSAAPKDADAPADPTLAKQAETQKLKTARSTAKREVTKQVNYMRRLIATDDIKTISDEVNPLKYLFVNFECAHNAYCELIVDDDELDRCEVYYDEVETNFVKVMGQVKRLLTSNDNNAKSEESEVVKLLGVLKEARYTCRLVHDASGLRRN